MQWTDRWVLRTFARGLVIRWAYRCFALGMLTGAILAAASLAGSEGWVFDPIASPERLLIWALCSFGFGLSGAMTGHWAMRRRPR